MESPCPTSPSQTRSLPPSERTSIWLTDEAATLAWLVLPVCTATPSTEIWLLIWRMWIVSAPALPST